MKTFLQVKAIFLFSNGLATIGNNINAMRGFMLVSAITKSYKLQHNLIYISIKNNDHLISNNPK